MRTVENSSVEGEHGESSLEEVRTSTNSVLTVGVMVDCSVMLFLCVGFDVVKGYEA